MESEQARERAVNDAHSRAPALCNPLYELSAAAMPFAVQWHDFESHLLKREKIWSNSLSAGRHNGPPDDL